MKLLKVDARIARRVTVDQFSVDITSNLNTTPTKWSFFLSRGGSAHPVKAEGVENPLVLSAPVNANKKSQIHEWLKSFNVNGMPHWTLYRDILQQISALRTEEKLLRKSHKEVQKIMARSNGK